MALYLGVINNGIFMSSDGYSLQDTNGLSLMAIPKTRKLKINLNDITYRVNVKLPAKESE